MLDPSELEAIRDFGEAPRPLTFWDFLGVRGNFELAAAFSTLFWPELVEVNGCVLLKEQLSRTDLTEWTEKLEGDRAGIEAMVNHVHMYDLFPNVELNVSDRVLLHLAQTLRLCWLAAAREQFPERNIDVELTNGPAEYGPTLTLCSR